MNGKRNFQPRFKTISPTKPKKGLSRVRKVTGEGKVFAEIIAERSIGGKTYSQVNGELIENPNHTNCAHLLSKKMFPEFRTRKDNIVILTFDQHYELDMGLKSKLQKDPKWNWVWEKIEELKQEYKKPHP